MRIEAPLLAGLLLLGTQLAARAQVQGFEGALISSGVEYGVRGWRAASNRLRKMLTVCAQ